MADWTNFGKSVAGSAVEAGMDMLKGSVSGLINNLFFRRNLNLQVEAQKELMDYQNEYNSPSAQMSRLAAAGLNPNLVYGSAAPAGISGNASAPSGVANPGNYNTADIIGGMMQLQQIKQSDANIESLEAKAELDRANAEYTKTQNARYNEVIDQNIRESNSRINKVASDISLNESSIQLNSAKKALAVADEAYRRGQIGLQAYERQVMLAQTRLYMSESSLKDVQGSFFGVQAKNAAIEGEILRIQFNYERIMKSSILTQKEKQARLKELEYNTKKNAARIGIDGSKFIQWYDWTIDHIEQGSKIFKNVMQ